MVERTGTLLCQFVLTGNFRHRLARELLENIITCKLRIITSALLWTTLGYLSHWTTLGKS